MAKTKKDRMDDIYSELDMLDEEPIALLSEKSKEIEARHEKEEEEEKKEEKEDYPKYSLFGEPESDEEWLACVSEMPRLNFKKRFSGDLFDVSEKGKKKKKKKKDGTTDFRKEFDPEMATLKHLLLDQNEFVTSLQSAYNNMTKQKSTVRGIGKYQNDLVSNITSARKVSADLVKQITDVKKVIADLSMKEKKELGLLMGGDENNVSEYASTFLKQLISGDRKSFMGDSDSMVEEANEDDMASYIGQSMESNEEYEERPEEVDKYLQYEGDNVSVKVILHSDGSQEFIALDGDGDIVPDYPLPKNSTKLNINRSTGKAKDEYGIAYEIIEE